ncbi:hypothetical protein E4U09_006990 [Claviceps aff. purpurea]|uniref:Uncharacterized protein n=1 Tax=Claviceps aff. purpurea TaxID=1967640 RepID=A0A9P7QAI3_9HYPO|nr:hypothetical protein E4U09_006990 [Claviceps aff. purpurea]
MDSSKESQSLSLPQSLSSTQNSSPTLPLMDKLSVQNGRLLSELFPFKKLDKLKEWLKVDCMQGAWAEFMRDCVTKLPNESVADPDKGTITEAARSAIDLLGKDKYLMYNPDKTAWTLDDHHVRFIVVVVRDNLVRHLWSQGDLSQGSWWQKKLEICKAVYELLCYLKTACFTVVDLGRSS